MITKELLNPKSIAVIGGSNDINKPGGKLLYNLLLGKPSNLYVVNPKDAEVQGVVCHKSISDLPDIDLAFICIAAKFAEESVLSLCRDKNTKAIVIISAGFGETDEAGKELEKRIVDICNDYKCSLIGPNCIGMLTPTYNGVFAGPIPKLIPSGCEFVTSSGATACFILEEAIMHGLPFSCVYSVGNGAQISVEDVVEY
jgi:acetyltransferase